MAINFPNAPTIGDTFQPPGSLFIYQWNGTSWIIPPGVVASIGHGQCRLVVTSTTVATLAPYDGNLLRIEGATRVIPATGIALSNGGLLADTTYFVYALDNAGTLELEAVTTGHATDIVTVGNIGVEIKTGDPSRTLVGMLRTNPAIEFGLTFTNADFDLINWFNRRRFSAQTNYSVNTTLATPTAVFTRIDIGTRVGCLNWADEEIELWQFGTTVSTSASTAQSALQEIGGPATNLTLKSITGSANFVVGIEANTRRVFPEGWHQFALFGISNSAAANQTWHGVTTITASQVGWGNARNG